MLMRSLIGIGLMLAGMALLGCNGTYTGGQATFLESNWGRSFEAAKYHQMLNPDAGKDLNPVEGLDGRAAEKNMEQYHKSFETPVPQAVYNVSNISLGTRGK
jgi:hypothetical protein